MKTGEKEQAVRKSRFPFSLILVFWVTLLLMSGIHTGLIVLANEEDWSVLVQILLPLAYWAFVAVELTLYTHWRIQKDYEKPMQKLAKATAQVAQGDFSVYVAPNHTMDKQDHHIQIILPDFFV